MQDDVDELLTTLETSNSLAIYRKMFPCAINKIRYLNNNDEKRQKELEELLAYKQKADEKIIKLNNLLSEAIYCIEDWGNYASDYFKEKHDFTGDLGRLRDLKDAIMGDEVGA